MDSLQLPMIDTHCHLYAEAFDVDRSDMIHRAIATGVSRMLLPNIDLESIDGMHQLVSEFPALCYPMMGLHPCSVTSGYKATLDHMANLLAQNQYVGIGETGTDLFWDKTFIEEQKDAFKAQISWAKELGLPIVIHSRETLDLNIEIIAEAQDGRLQGIFHCFTGSVEQALRIDALGFKIGIGGVSTFKNGGLDKVLPQIPAAMMVLETDAPYLAPVPYRGKRNESAYLSIIAERLAQILTISTGEVAELTTRNAMAVFEKKG